MARGGNSVVVIKWRDIPAQVNAQMGRDRYQVVLSAKFQRAIDRAKRKANIYTAEEDIAQWSRDTLPLEGTLAEAAQKVADEIEAKYSRQHLGVLAYAGGFEKDIEQLTVAAKDLAALEELEEEMNEEATDNTNNEQQ
jgi:Virulence factor